jgi:thiazole synthase
LIVHEAKSQGLTIGSLRLKSRLIVGTGKYKNADDTRACLDVSGAHMVTVAIRRVPTAKEGEPSLWDLIPKSMHILPNTAGCYTVDDCVRTAHLARELLGEEKGKYVKVEVIGDEKTLFPDVGATIEATRRLVQDGFITLPYITDDPVSCLKLIDAGAAAVMPLAAPIGSGLGIRNPINLAIILELVHSRSDIPVIVDAGVGTASDAARAMEMGVDGVLMNTAIATARNAPQIGIQPDDRSHRGALNIPPFCLPRHHKGGIGNQGPPQYKSMDFSSRSPLQERKTNATRTTICIPARRFQSFLHKRRNLARQFCQSTGYRWSFVFFVPGYPWHASSLHKDRMGLYARGLDADPGKVGAT